MKLLTREQAQELDRIAIREMNIPGKTLMGNAGRHVAQAVREISEDISEPKIVVVCGKGNNGGDGYAAAVKLQKWSLNVKILAIGNRDSVKGDPLHFYLQCEQQGIEIIHGPPPTDELPVDIIIDGLLGTGFHGKLRGSVCDWVDWINAQECEVVSIDIPSGVDANSGTVDSAAVGANLTVSMGYGKVGMEIYPGKDYCGEIMPVDVGFPEEEKRLGGLTWQLFNEASVPDQLTIPLADTHKHRQGKVLILAGSTGMTGAAVMSTQAALRTGAGLTVTCAPESLNQIYEIKLTEGMTVSCPDGGRGFLGPENWNEIEPFVSWADVILIGPGLGKAPETQSLIETVLGKVEKPLVIDADGLILFHLRSDLFQSIKGPFVITPHHGELGQILGRDPADVKRNLTDVLEEFMQNFSGVLVAKNAPTCTAFKETVTVNTSGNPGMATAGSGDILTGMIASLIAQGMDLFEASQLAVFLHGMAADTAAEELGYRGLMATDILDTIPGVIAYYELG